MVFVSGSTGGFCWINMKIRPARLSVRRSGSQDDTRTDLEISLLAVSRWNDSLAIYFPKSGALACAKVGKRFADERRVAGRRFSHAG